MNKRKNREYRSYHDKYLNFNLRDEKGKISAEIYVHVVGRGDGQEQAKAQFDRFVKMMKRNKYRKVKWVKL